MVRKISSYSISLLCSLLLLLALPAQAQYAGSSSTKDTRPVAKKKEKKPAEIEYPLYNGVSVGLDLWGIGSRLFGGDFLSSEVIASVDLKHRFFPTVEVGYGQTDAWNDNGIHYKSGAPYFRIGMDYNALYKKKHGQMLLVGLRYGFSSFSYDIESMSVSDPIYGGSIGNPNLIDDIWGGSISYRHSGMTGSMQWLELGVGIRAHIWKPLYMGWGLRFRFRLSASTGQYGDPWYVPGFGTYKSNTLGVQYSIIYKLPF